MTPELQEYFCGNELACKTFYDKYALRDKNDKVIEKTPDEMHRRMARELARIEKNKFAKPLSEDEIYFYFKDFQYIIPQGSNMYGIGNEQYVSLSNCYVISSPLDSYAGIHQTDQQLTQISKRRGGVGFDISNIRPINLPTKNSSRTTTGIIPFMERYSNSIREVGQSGRRGALMMTLSVHHPQIIDFAEVKLDGKKVTGANLSVRLTDEFLEAVDKGAKYEQRWPVDAAVPVISNWVDAKNVWNRLCYCAWKRAEPGLLFWDNIINESPADCYSELGFRTLSTNPCAELPICEDDSCRLLLLMLFAYVMHPFTPKAYFDYDLFEKHAIVAQRLMDDIIDLETECINRIISKIKRDPEPLHVKQQELDLWKKILVKCINGRRTGTGITALGDTLAGLGISYGSDASIAVCDRIYKTLKLACYKSSVDMAEELGPFPIWNAVLEADNPFLNRIKQEDVGLWEKMQKFGRRNIALLTTPPAGSTSIVAGPRPYFETTSGGEPLFTWKPYKRRKKINFSDKDTRVDFVDESGDRWQEFEVFHSKIKMWMDITGETDVTKSPYYGCTAEEIDWQKRVEMQATAQKHVDHSISSTLNLPEDVTEEKVRTIYETSWRKKCKGQTVYRKNCRAGVLIDKDQPKAGNNSPKRPKELPCDIYTINVNKEKYFVTVSLLEGYPYEIFSAKEEPLTRHDRGIVKKVKRGLYELWSEDNKKCYCENMIANCLPHEEALTRMVSISLRHGVAVEYVVHQLEKTKGDILSFSKSLSRALKKYIADGAAVSGEACSDCGKDLVRENGCVICKSCGNSKCS